LREKVDRAKRETDEGLSKGASMTPLDPGMLAFYKTLTAQTPPGSELWPLDRQRSTWNAVCAAFRAPRPETVEAFDLVANGVACRIFKPKSGALKPGILYSHGGGWVLGSPDTHDDICAEMAAGADCVVVLTDYRLAPEHRHPAQLEDTLKVWRWMREMGSSHGINPNHIIAAGDSAGGQMSVALSMTLRDLGLPQVQAMALFYPVLGANMETPSYIRNANAPCLTRDDMRYYLTSFLGPENSANWQDEKAVPLMATRLEGLPPAYITVAGHDPLHDDGVMFHERLLTAGNVSELRSEAALAHSYLRARHHSAVAMDGFQAIVAALRKFGAMDLTLAR
jgi:acetyl esterase